MNDLSVDFETKCYENDWKFILKTSYLKRNIARCNFKFNTKRLIINNVNNRAEVAKYADLAVARNILDEYVFVEDLAAETLNHFQLTKKSFKGGYYYSISELVGLYVSTSPYLLHFSSDSFMATRDLNWISEALQVLSTNPEILVANPCWNNKFNEAKAESFAEIPNFYVSYGFSDQCYLVRTKDFKENIYEHQHEASDRYPLYGGELFEKRVDSYMRNHALKRITHNKASYRHHNFPKTPIKRFLRFIRPMA